MSKPLPLTDHRAMRSFLTSGDYGLPGEMTPFTPIGRIKPETWKNLVGLSDSVAIETSDEFPAELERADRIDGRGSIFIIRCPTTLQQNTRRCRHSRRFRLQLSTR